MFYFFRKKVIKKRVKKSQKSKKIYLENKEKARGLIKSKLEYFNNFYKFNYNIVAIRDQKTRWGSCSSKGNLNFNYRVVFLEQDLVDYIVVHELCHLKEMNHGAGFWDLVALQIPDYKLKVSRLRLFNTGSF